MKRTYAKFSMLLCIILSMAVLCACGGRMTGWPQLELNLDIESYDEVSLEYHHNSSHSDRMPFDVDRHFFGTSSDKELIKDIYQSIDGILYSEETYQKIDTENYYSKEVITFWKDGKAEYTFSYYGYAVTDGYFVLDNGEIHKFLADFIHGTYGRFKDRFNQEEEK